MIRQGVNKVRQRTPPIDSVKNSSTVGPMPSSGPRTDLDRATPAKK